MPVHLCKRAPLRIFIILLESGKGSALQGHLMRSFAYHSCPPKRDGTRYATLAGHFLTPLTDLAVLRYR
jgi:hypothetical protein